MPVTTRHVLNLVKFTAISSRKLPEIMKRPSKQPSPEFRNICTSSLVSQKETQRNVVRQGAFERIDNKNHDTYLDVIRIFINRDNVYRRGHVDFIYSALKHMETFGVDKDLKVYKALIDVLPKGKFVARNMLQAEFMHYPKQQQCVIDLLQQMEDNGVMPDAEIQDQLINIFGRRAYPLRKYWRMMYWMPKFKYADPFSITRDQPNDVLQLAKEAVRRISSVDPRTEISEYQTKDIEQAIDDTWIISAQSPIQRKLLKIHDLKEPIYVEGAFQVWLRDKSVNYFTLRANPKALIQKEYDEDDVSGIKLSMMNLKPPVQKHLVERATVHEQEDGTIFSVCATGTSTKDSLLSWIRHLERNGNEALCNVPVVFTLRSVQSQVEISDPTKENMIETTTDGGR